MTHHRLFDISSQCMTNRVSSPLRHLYDCQTYRMVTSRKSSYPVPRDWIIPILCAVLNLRLKELISTRRWKIPGRCFDDGLKPSHRIVITPGLPFNGSAFLVVLRRSFRYLPTASLQSPTVTPLGHEISPLLNPPPPLLL